MKTKEKGDLAEIMVIADLVSRGYKVAIPYGEDWRYDLIVDTHEGLQRVQCKYTKSNGAAIKVPARSVNNWSEIKYTSDMIDWIAVFDAGTDSVYYIPSSELGEGMAAVTLRLKPAKNGQTTGVRLAKDYTDFV